MSKHIRVSRGWATHTRTDLGSGTPRADEFGTKFHCVDASSLDAADLTCKVFFSPSEKICREEKRRTSLSRRLTKLLRHEAARRGLPVGSDGYVCVKNILSLPDYCQFTVSDVLFVVKSDGKKRYSVRVDSRAPSNTISDSSRGGGDSVPTNSNHTAIEALNRLAEKNRGPLAGSTLSNEGPQLEVGTAARYVRQRLRVTEDRFPSATSPQEILYVEYWRSSGANEGHEETSNPAQAVGRRAAGASSIPEPRHTAGLLQPATAPAASMRSISCEVDSTDCSWSRALPPCGPKAPGAAAAEVSNATSEGSAAVDLRNECRLLPRYVDASLLSIRAVQGHSMPFVDSDKLLRRIWSAADLVTPGTAPITRAVTSPPSGRLERGFGRAGQAAPVHTAAGVAALAPAPKTCVVHGTYWRHWESIRQRGLCRMSRNHIHFATRLPEEGEVISGMRSNVEVLIFLHVERALSAGLRLYLSDNGVVLCPGNEEGIIECRFFEKVVDRKTGNCLPICGGQHAPLQTK